MLMETSIFKLPGKVPLRQKCQNVLCGNMNNDVAPYILKFKYLFCEDCLDSCLSIVLKKQNDIPSQKVSSNYYSYKRNKSSRYVLS